MSIDLRVIGARVKITRELRSMVGEIFPIDHEFNVHSKGNMGLNLIDDEGKKLLMCNQFDDAIVLVE